MEYLKLTRGRITLAGLLAVSVLLATFPGIDLWMSKLFYQNGFQLATRWWSPFLQVALPCFLVISMTSVVGVYLYNRRWQRNLGAIDGRKVVYLLVVLVLGGGVIVNLALKDHVGRARPRDVVEFGGTRQYTPPFVISRECERNCSFASGDAAAGFFALALARVVSRKRAVLAAGFGIGAVVSLSRVAVGAHFLSDVVVSFFVMWILTDVLYFYAIAPSYREPSRTGRIAARGREPRVARAGTSRPRA